MSDMTVQNTGYLVKRIIDQAPGEMQIREFMQNAIEAAMQHPTSPKIHVFEANPADFGYGNDILGDFNYNNKKLAIWNNGVGMTPETLRKITNISSTDGGKTQALTANFGIGINTTLSVNKAGLIIVTCYKGKVSTVLLREETDKLGFPSYVRYDFSDTNSGAGTNFQDVANITALDTIPWAKNEDWTAVILCGNQENQTTVNRPFDPAHEENSAWFYNMLYRRFFSVPDNLEIKINLSHGTRRNSTAVSDTVKFKSVSKFIDDYDKNILQNVKTEKVTLSNGINIHYTYDGPYGEKNKQKDAQQRPATTVNNQSTCLEFSGLVYQNEIYDLCTSGTSVSDRTKMAEPKWKKVAAHLGILFDAKYFRIFVELPVESNIFPDQYRQRLNRNDTGKSVCKIEDYSDEILDNMPEWFREKIADHRPKGLNQGDAHERAKQFFNQLKAISTASKSTNGNNTGKANRNSPTKKGTNASTNRTKTINIAGNSFNVFVEPPPFQIIYDKATMDTVSATGLENRAAEYVEGQILYINSMYHIVEKCVEELVNEHLTKRDDETIEKIKQQSFHIVCNEMAFLVYEAIGLVLSKKTEVGFTPEDIEVGLNPMNLSTHADKLFYNLDECKRQLKEFVKVLDSESILDNSEEISDIAIKKETVFGKTLAETEKEISIPTISLRPDLFSFAQ